MSNKLNNFQRSMHFSFICLAVFVVIVAACDNPNGNASAPSNSAVSAGEQARGTVPDPEPTPVSGGSRDTQPRTVRDFFMLLPEKYFVLEGCDKSKDKDCRKARLDYLKTFAEVEDTGNGYLKGGCDGAQSCMEMALFKRPDGTYLVGLATSAEMMNDYYFLDHSNGKWTDVSSRVVPEFSRKNIYELPRYGTTVQVFAKNITEKGDDYEVSEKGAKLYDLEWKDGRFAKK
jgi:hypothetical protein